MNRFWLSTIALFALTAEGQNVNFTDIQHIHTALDHLTVIELGEPIQLVAAADPDSFQIERSGDKVLLRPLKESTSTNLILWTASRQISYELDAPGDVSKMNVLVRNLPPSTRAMSDAPTDKERREIADAATKGAMLAAEDVIADQVAKNPPTSVSASVVRVLHTSEGTYLQYQIVNRSTAPFRVTTPTVVHLSPTQVPISLLALRNHQLSSQTLNSLKAKQDGTSATITGESQVTDVTPGGSTTGYVLIHSYGGTTPEVYQLNFGSTSAGALIDTVVI